ncbi:hypothetical protein PR003_g25941 [Phytophthora rubi]|uniref:Uncharacterized protein n=1 Tax=Phytophthora rubi TaxID=129364 RepID=A0A6A3ICJ5_9STRA|nr:hypothetical protein PR002_g25218 [Phytophthora rubi]KAE8979691.1 hypothetical protein PR001_g24480 [Phytophthora rubi]KAE9287874.1 hypothetical protein PR003_g25941 [Phytophthora rubi]
MIRGRSAATNAAADWNVLILIFDCIIIMNCVLAKSVFTSYCVDSKVYIKACSVLHHVINKMHI